MITAGIICEYNPIHDGHVRHITETREIIGGEAAIVCAMSGNFVQRGDLAIFEKHARARAAVASGADLVVELPVAYCLSSAENFARGGVMLLDALGVCTHISFGSEAGETENLDALADCFVSGEIAALLKKELAGGMSYPKACQNAATTLLGDKAAAMKTPNNVLGIEYLKALKSVESSMKPVTVLRKGAAHDSAGAESASYLRALLKDGVAPWDMMPPAAAVILTEEIIAGRGPVFMERAELAVLSRLRMLPAEAFSQLPDATEGLGNRLMQYAKTMPTLSAILEKTKTKRYTMSRLRRMLLCAVLGIRAGDSLLAPAYIRVLAMNGRGRRLLRTIKESSALPVITKPASVSGLDRAARAMFEKEAATTDFYALAYPVPGKRSGGQEWRISPGVLE